MYIQQADLFHGMDGDFVKEIMDITTKVTFETGEYLFREGDPADNFYILLKGRVTLRTGEIGQVVHMVSHSGEAFGWSSLAGRSTYSASAMCETPTKLLSASGEQVTRIVENHPEQGLVFYRHLAHALGSRLIQAYQTLSSMSQGGVAPSFGAGNIMEAPEAEVM
jgi:CRP-like cAMP-binding protein